MCSCPQLRLCISIHSLRMEGDSHSQTLPGKSLKFQSTPSAWRETCIGSGLADSLCISIHSLRMEGDRSPVLCLDLDSEISIHSLRMEGDLFIEFRRQRRRISIHSLRMEGDNLHSSECIRYRHFNPLPPHGGRRRLSRLMCVRCDFNPLPPHGGRLVTNPFSLTENVFQSTPSAWRETGSIDSFLQFYGNFNPLPPHGGRLSYCHFFTHSIRHFNPLPPHGGRLEEKKQFALGKAFQSTPSAWRETQLG